MCNPRGGGGGKIQKIDKTGWDGTLYNGLYGKALPKRDTFLEFRYMKGQGLHMKGFGKSVIADYERTYKD